MSVILSVQGIAPSSRGMIMPVSRLRDVYAVQDGLLSFPAGTRLVSIPIIDRSEGDRLNRESEK